MQLHTVLWGCNMGLGYWKLEVAALSDMIKMILL